MKLSFRNRIASYYLIATALIMALAFITVYIAVRQTVFYHLDRDLTIEAYKHTDEIRMENDSLIFIHKEEWEEREHLAIQVNPVFIQILDTEGRVMDRSPNLKGDFLPNDPDIIDKHHDAMLNERYIRMMRIPLEHDGQVKGYIVAAMSSESAHSILITLLNTLIIAYLTIIAGLYFFSRFLAGKSMAPVKEMTQTMSRITRNNLTERVQLPAHKDELHALSTHFNALLERIEKAIDREKQFTSDASHELRTPLAILRGTLEVLIRKSRTEEEYQDKINYCLSEIDHMSSTLEQLLLLARLDATDSVQHSPATNLQNLVDSITQQLSKEIASKSVRIDVVCEAPSVQVPEYHARLMLENVLSNAIKYSHDGGTIFVHIFSENEQNICTVTNTGIGIKPEDLDHVFDAFFRSAPLEHRHIPGNGLGLSIAQRCAKAIDATITLKSDSSSTTATLNFKPILREF